MATEIGMLYNDTMLTQLLIATILNKPSVAVSDYDGPIFHKKDPQKTRRCVQAFQTFTPRILCSARSTKDLLASIQAYDFQVDWIIAYSGAVVTDGKGRMIWMDALTEKELEYLTHIFPIHEKIEVNHQVIQLVVSQKLLEKIKMHTWMFHKEVYKEKVFISSWQTGKLRAICQLLQYINWCGTVQAFGDGQYDKPFLTYFDGRLLQR